MANLDGFLRPSGHRTTSRPKLFKVREVGEEVWDKLDAYDIRSPEDIVALTPEVICSSYLVSPLRTADKSNTLL